MRSLSIHRDLFEFMRDIKIAHSVFALPFAFSAVFLTDWSLPTARQLVLLIICMVAARSFAMGINRLLDAHIDARNPRTQHRAIPSGRIALRSVFFISVFWGALFCAAAFALNATAGWCSFGVLGIFTLYPFWKRISWLTHWYLGLCLCLSPIAMGVALGAPLSASIFFLAGGILFWVAGFDILYAVQDFEIDKAQNLQSIPAQFGIRTATDLSRGCFVITVVSLCVCGYLANMGAIYYFGLLVICGLLTYEQFLVRDLRVKGTSKNLNLAFFNMNAYVSVLFFVACLLDFYL